MINGEKLQAAGIDYQAGLSRFMNDSELYEAVLNAFIGENILQRSQKAYEARDNDSLLKAVHEAKGSSGNAGFDELYRVSGAMVALLRSGSFSEQALAELYQSFVSTYEKVTTGVKAALSD